MRRTQEDRSAGTKAALIAAARPLFAERGYAAVPAEEIVRAAGVTRGALHHHYGDKQGLFRAVFEELEREMTADIREAMDAAGDVESAIAAGALPPRPVGVLAQLVLSAAIETALLIANSADPAGTRAESESVLGAWFAGLLAQNNGPLA